MDKNKLIIGGVILVILLIIGGYFMAGRADAPSELTGKNEETLADKLSEKLSLAGLIAQGKSQSCAFTNSTAGVESSGTVYMSGGKMRGDFKSTVNGKIETTHMIIDGKESRIWIDGQASGYLMKVPAKSDTAVSSDTAVAAQPNQMPFDLNDNTSTYDCTTWNADASVFVPPANIDFVSMEDMMKGMMPSGATAPGASGSGSAGYSGSGQYDAASMKAMQCSTCEQVKDTASKAECKAAFQCQ